MTCRVQATFDRPPLARPSCSPSGFYHIWLDGKDVCECGRDKNRPGITTIPEQSKRVPTLREIVRARIRP